MTYHLLLEFRIINIEAHILIIVHGILHFIFDFFKLRHLGLIVGSPPIVKCIFLYSILGLVQFYLFEI